MRWEEGVGGHMGRVEGDGDGRGMRNGAQDGGRNQKCMWVCLVLDRLLSLCIGIYVITM